jgi:crossover junction endodeoxyribonuclease RuvC
MRDSYRNEKRFQLCLLRRGGFIAAVGMTPQQFQQVQERLARKRTPAPVNAELARPAARKHQVVLGIDPSLRGTGYGILRVERGGARLVTCGTVHCAAGWARSRCLLAIAQTLRDVLRQNSPEVCVIEGLFYAQNLQTALIMGEARGVAMAAAAEAGLEIYEIATRKVKQAIVGYGAAQKLAVAKMVQRMLSLPELPTPDAADALALALTFAQEQGRYSLSPPKPL